MRRRSTKQNKENERLKVKEEPHLSGAYIRSLVKQLTSSRPKEPMNPKSSQGLIDGEKDEFSPSQSILDEGLVESQTQPQEPPKPKKQVRRRLHTSRPYQERLLNMAEARREIVTALKFHRAAMKQANEQQQQQQQHHQHPEQKSQLQSPQLDPCPPFYLEPQEKMKSRRNPRIYPSNSSTSHLSTTTTTFSEYLNNISLSPFSQEPPPCAPSSFSWCSNPYSSLPACDNLNLSLPHQPLGLNLNLHDFSNIETAFCQNSNQSIYTCDTSSSLLSSSSSSSSSSSTSTSPSPSVMDAAPSMALNSVVDEEEIAKIRSIGDQHEMEWNDTMNLVTSAWWFKFLKSMDKSPDSNEERGEEEAFHWFDEAMEIPAWLNDGGVGSVGETTMLQQHLDYSHLQDAALPCLDIGEIEGMEGDWLAS